MEFKSIFSKNDIIILLLNIINVNSKGLEKIDLTNLLQLYFENQQLKKPKI